MEGAKDVILHVYELQSTNSNSSGSASFFSRLLPSIGMAPHHTSLEVDGYRYTFAANAGIVKTLSHNEGVPTGAVYKEAIELGSCSCNRGQINAILQQLQKVFHGNSYHLVHRNCNHFTETFATAIILNDELLTNKNPSRLKTYPEWINRLAATGGVFISHDDDIVPCNVLEEARKATGADEKVSWDLTPTPSLKTTLSGSSKKKSSSQKKELTAKQKAMLAKIKGGSSKK